MEAFRQESILSSVVIYMVFLCCSWPLGDASNPFAQ